MITYGTKLTVTEDGIEKAVQDLCIGERIFNPITCTYDEISDILQRQVDISEPNSPGHNLCPVVIPQGSLHSSCPKRSLYLSPRQIILVAERRPAGNYPVTTSTYACSEVSSERVKTPGRISYLAIFFEQRRFIDAGGVLLQAYTIDDISAVRHG